MKFAKRLEFEAMPEWRNEYIAYKELKKIIKRINSIAFADNTADSEKGQSGVISCQQEVAKDFEFTLERELAKVEKFFSVQLNEAVKRKKFVFNQLKELIKQFSKNQTVEENSGSIKSSNNSGIIYNSNKSLSDTGHGSATSGRKNQLQVFDEVLTPFQQIDGSSTKHRKNANTSNNGSDRTKSTNPLSFTKQIQNISHNKTLPSLHYLQYEGRMLLAKSHIKRALLELYNLLIILSSYQKINILAYTKIVKKFEKNYLHSQDEYYEYAERMKVIKLIHSQSQQQPTQYPRDGKDDDNLMLVDQQHVDEVGVTLRPFQQPPLIDNITPNNMNYTTSSSASSKKNPDKPWRDQIHSVQGKLMQQLIESMLYKDNSVNLILKELDAIFTNYFPHDTTYQQLVQDRHITSTDPNQFHVATGGNIFTSQEFLKFLGGFLCGMNFLSCIYLMNQYVLNDLSIQTMSKHDSRSVELVSMQFIYFALGLPILLGNGVIANMYIWQHFKINYRLIFGCTHSMLPIHFTILIASYTLFYLQFVINSLSGEMTSIPRQHQPIVLVLSMLGFSLFPGGFFYGDSRVWWNKAVYRLVTTPYYPIQFKDFFIADQWMSMSPFFAGIGWLVCFTTTGQIGLNSGGTMPVLTWYTLLCMVLPPWLRCIQCLRRYWQQIHDATATTATASSTAYLHLVNFGKYCFSIATVLLPGIQASYPQDQLPHIIISIRFVATLYSLIWDIVMDFGLGQMRALPVPVPMASSSAVKFAEVATGAAWSSTAVVYNVLLQYIPVPNQEPTITTATNEQRRVSKSHKKQDDDVYHTQLQGEEEGGSVKSSGSEEDEGSHHHRHEELVALDDVEAAAAAAAASAESDQHAPSSSSSSIQQQGSDERLQSVSISSKQSATRNSKTSGNVVGVGKGPKMMIYPLWYYYLILLLDTLLRFVWLPFVNNTTYDPSTIYFVTACLEVIRRVCWNVFRVEIEHVHNCIAERVIDTTTVTLPFITEELYHGYN